RPPGSPTGCCCSRSVLRASWPTLQSHTRARRTPQQNSRTCARRSRGGSIRHFSEPNLGLSCPPRGMLPIRRHSPPQRASHPSVAVEALDGRRGCTILARNRSVQPAAGTAPRTAHQGATLMKTLTSVACVLLMLGAGASAQTLDDLKKDGNGGSTDNILTYGMGYHQQRYSPLKEINKQTVKRLVPVWNVSLDNNWGEQAQPIVYNGVMYVTNARATVAIDVATGKQIWKQALDWPPETPRVVCCGVSNKGAAIYNGKVFRTT